MATLKKEKKRIVVVVNPKTAKTKPVDRGLVAIVKIADQEFKVRGNAVAKRMTHEAGTFAAILGREKFSQTELKRVVAAQMIVKDSPVIVGISEGMTGGISLKAEARLYLGKKYLSVKAPLETEEDYIWLIRKGIPKKSIDHLISTTDIPVVEMAELMETTPRKLAAIKPDTIMEKSQSEKAVSIARLYALGEEIFGSKEEFNKWMNGRVQSLGKKMPKEYLDTTSGINLLMDELGRIQHGVYS